MKSNLFCFLAALLLAVSVQAQVYNRPPLVENLYAELPLGAIQPAGWLREQLQRQASGLTGHLDEVYPQVMGPSNAWLGGDGDAWERGPYWIDGLLPLAYILQDQELIDKANHWVEAILASQQEDGYLGPAVDHPFVYGLQRGQTHDWWPKMVALKILKQYYMATADERVLRCLQNYFAYQAAQLQETPLDHWTDWGRWRGADNLEVVYWLYNMTGDPALLHLGERLHAQTADWTALFLDGDIFSRQGSLHCVNLGQGFKAPAVWWQYSHESRDLEALDKAVETIRHTVGLPTGLWAGDEQLHFGVPTRGSELCTAVEMMFSLEEILRITGDVRWADYLERVAFNALPTQVNDDYTGKQYYQQVNQVSATKAWRPFSTPHDDTDVLFGTLNGYPCCLSNMHQGWPKFTQNLWYATSDGGLAALVYAPCEVTAKLAGMEVRVVEETAYPFREHVRLTVDFPEREGGQAAFPLRFRVPAWCAEATLSINGERVSVTPVNGVFCLERNWQQGDVVDLHFPMKVRTEAWYDQAWSVVRGPLLYALRMEENWSWNTFSHAERYYGPGAWEVTSPTAWNYCLMRDSFSAEACALEERPLSAYPWNVENAPLVLQVPARKLPHWTHVDSVAYWTEDGNDTGDPSMLSLIPYGCTTLRIAAFPTRIVPWDLKFKKEIQICAHRGFWNCEEAGNAQNSIASLRLAQENSFWGSEFDVHLTADNVIVVNHDPSINGMSIQKHTYRQLLRTQLPNGERIPTLREYLMQGAQSPCKLVLEIKPQKSLRRTIKLVKACVEELRRQELLDPSRVMFISFSFEACQWIAQELPGFGNQYLEGDKAPETVHAAGINGIDYHYIAFRKHPDWVERAHALGMDVNVWTVDSKDEMEYLRDLGVDIITTNVPLILRSVLQEAD